MTQHGLVIAHRWFNCGEGWAYHPDLAPTLPELVKALSPELHNRQSLSPKSWRQFRIEVPGGMIIGIHRLDPKSPDHKAMGRAPSVLIGVFVAKGEQIEVESIVEAMTALEPEVEGADQLLLLKNMNRTRKKLWRKWMVRGLIVAIPILVLSALTVRSQDNYERSQQRVREVMLELTNKRSSENGTSKHTRDEDASWRRFCNIFCKPTDLPDNNSHPDVVWLKSLLSMPEGLSSEKRWNPQWKDYIPMIEQWAKERNVPSDISVLSDADKVGDVLRNIVADINYPKWTVAQLLTNQMFRSTFCVGSVSPLDLQKHPLLLANPAGSPAGYAKPLYELMKDWDVKEVTESDVGRRPWFVIQAFFAFLNRERFQTMGNSTPYDQFVSRLPVTNVLHKSKYDISSKETVDKALAELLEQVSGSRPSLTLDLPSAASLIKNSLDYDKWRKGRVDELMTKKRELDGKYSEEYDTEFRIIQEQLDAFDTDAPVSTTTPDIAEFVKRFSGSNK